VTKAPLPPNWLEHLSHARNLQLTAGADTVWAYLETLRKSQPNPEAAQVWVDRIADALEQADPEASMGHTV